MSTTTIKTVADLEREVCVNCDVCWASTRHEDCCCGWWRHFQRLDAEKKESGNHESL